MIAASGGDDPGAVRLALHELLEIHRGAARLECAYRRVILVLQPHVGAECRGNLRPHVLRRRRHQRRDELPRGLDGGAVRQRRRFENWRLTHGVCGIHGDGNIRARSSTVTVQLVLQTTRLARSYIWRYRPNKTIACPPSSPRGSRSASRRMRCVRERGCRRSATAPSNRASAVPPWSKRMTSSLPPA